MQNDITSLEPKALWKHFAALNSVPRPSKKEERIIKFMQDFGNSQGFHTITDEVGNVIISKPATKGMEDRQTVVLQSHLDMVHQKNADTDFDFNSQGIEMFVDGDWVKAKGTTLGADNGIGVATIMALLTSTDIPHPPLEALFTIDEETGMTGAMGLQGGILKGTILLNLDTEEDHELTIGCAGGVDVTATGTYHEENIPFDFSAYSISLTGLTGGHSGMEIHLGRANANKLMNRVLFMAADLFSARVSRIDGGSLRNAIPRESFAELAVPEASAADFEQFLKSQADIFQSEYALTDPNLQLKAEHTDLPEAAISYDFQKQLLRAVYACPHGIYRMSPAIEGLVQTSNNLARVVVKDGTYSIQCLTRSSVDTEKFDLAQAIQSTFELVGASVIQKGSYPGWTPNPSSAIVETMTNLYRQLFKEEPHVNACHAGLECGILGTNYPEMEMISFGPTITGAHSPDEKVQISSVQKFWGFLLETLLQTPKA